MKKYYHVTIYRRPVRSSPDQAESIAEVVFETDQHADASFIFDALDAMGFPKAGSDTLTELGRIMLLDNFPFGPDAEKPDWTSETAKVWLIAR